MVNFDVSGYRLIRAIYQQFIHKNCLTFASNLTLSTLLAIVPLMLVGVSILSIFPFFSQWTSHIEQFIFSNFLPASGEIIQTYVLSFVTKASELSWIGIIFLLASAILMLFNIEQAFNAIWGVKRQRKGIKAIGLYSLILVLAPLLIATTFILSNYLISFSFIAIISHTLNGILIDVIPFCLASVLFILLYIIIPNCSVPFQYASLSGLITAFLFELAKYAFAIYLHFFNTYQLIYGALASFPIFLNLDLRFLDNYIIRHGNMLCFDTL